MSSLKAHFGLFAAVLALLALPELAEAQASSTTRLNTYTLSIMGGLGGSIDEDESGFDNSAFQLGFSSINERSVKLGARVGSIGSIDRLGNLFDADLTYATIAGEYLFGEAGYQSGMFLGLGVYRLEGSRLFTGEEISTTTVGLTGGVTGEFDISRRVGILAELSFHGLTQGEAEFFVNGLVGVAIYFK